MSKVYQIVTDKVLAMIDSGVAPLEASLESWRWQTA